MANKQKQTAALIALSESTSLTEAAAKAGISPRTLYSYIHDDIEFSQEYKSIQEQAIIAVTENMAGCVDSAISAIKDIVESDKTPAAVRLKAAIAILSIYDNHCAEISKIASGYVSANKASSILDGLFSY